MHNLDRIKISRPARALTEVGAGGDENLVIEFMWPKLDYRLEYDTWSMIPTNYTYTSETHPSPQIDAILKFMHTYLNQVALTKSVVAACTCLFSDR